MANNSLTLSRKHVLGDLYSRCDPVESVPIYWSDPSGPMVGFVGEAEGDYSDAFTFHMSDDLCRKLAGGQVLCRFNYEFAGETDQANAKTKRRLSLTSFVLTAPPIHGKPPVEISAAEVKEPTG